MQVEIGTDKRNENAGSRGPRLVHAVQGYWICAFRIIRFSFLLRTIFFYYLTDSAVPSFYENWWKSGDAIKVAMSRKITKNIHYLCSYCIINFGTSSKCVTEAQQ